MLLSTELFRRWSSGLFYETRVTNSRAVFQSKIDPQVEVYLRTAFAAKFLTVVDHFSVRSAFVFSCRFGFCTIGVSLYGGF